MSRAACFSLPVCLPYVVRVIDSTTVSSQTMDKPIIHGREVARVISFLLAVNSQRGCSTADERQYARRTRQERERCNFLLGEIDSNRVITPVIERGATDQLRAMKRAPDFRNCAFASCASSILKCVRIEYVRRRIER